MAIVVGVARAELSLPGARGLKDKRRLVKSLVERAQHRFRVSAAEVDHHEVWTRAAVAFACISTSGRHAHQILAEIHRFVEHQSDMVLVDYQVEIR
ncbi:MAG: DUF503 domain-containing protein [Armatimonadota bacterium]|nr:DUF503 domain-containing protein [Armatimonadota bacterium]MDR7532361.1 DUF503 domain-containing protein [Armatimonadota bacterium]MDR7535288.1 DUF503 domain-containing protein [Armatimonadota bacterium]